MKLIKLTINLLSIKFGSSLNKDYEYKRTIFYFLKNLGGVYIKFLQMIALNKSFMSGWSGPKEMDIFQDVATEPINVVKLVPDEKFYQIDTEPFAAGSFAQVYKAKLNTGEELVIKALRPSIIKNINNDLKTIKRIHRIVKLFLPNTVIDFGIMVDEFCRSTRLETDYENEIANIEAFYYHYLPNDNVVVPRPYKELSSKSVIVQDYIAGPTFAEILQKRTIDKPATQLAYEMTGSDLWTQLTIAGGEFLGDAFVADYVMGDPHPGNIKLLSDNKIGLIDFGIVANPPARRRAFYNYCIEFLRVGQGYRKVDKILAACLDFFCPNEVAALNSFTIDDSQDKIESILDRVIVAFDDKMTTMNEKDKVKELFNNGQMFKIIFDVLDKNNSLNIKVSNHDMLFMKSCNVFLSSLHTLDLGETKKGYAKCFFNAINYSLKKAEIYGLREDLSYSPKYNKAEGCELIVDMLSQLASNDPFVFERLASRM